VLRSAEDRYRPDPGPAQRAPHEGLGDASIAPSADAGDSASSRTRALGRRDPALRFGPYPSCTSRGLRSRMPARGSSPAWCSHGTRSRRAPMQGSGAPVATKAGLLPHAGADLLVASTGCAARAATTIAARPSLLTAHCASLGGGGEMLMPSEKQVFAAGGHRSPRPSVELRRRSGTGDGCNSINPAAEDSGQSQTRLLVDNPTTTIG
jgi:hypothetical protein